MAGVRDGIVKRGKTWSYVIRVLDPTTGMTKPRWVGGFPTEGEAKKARDEARVAARRGEFVARNGVTVAVYLRQWLEGHALQVKPKTHEDYQRLIDGYVVPHIGRMRLQNVRPATLSALYATLLQKGGKNGRPLSARTVGYVHAVLRKALNDAVIVDQIIPSNPALRAKRPRTTNAVHQITSVWAADELATFLHAARAERLFPLFHVAAYTGARRGELLFLRWADVHLDGPAPRIEIRGATSIVGGRRVEGTTKTGLARFVSIDRETVDVLRAWKSAQDAEREFAGDSWHGDDHVFLTQLGAELPPWAPGEVMHRIMRAVNDDAGEEVLPVLRFHDLRHTHATLLLQAGVPVHVVAERLGHRDPALTLRVYAHVLRTQASEVAETFALAVSGTAVSTTVSKNTAGGGDQ